MQIGLRAEGVLEWLALRLDLFPVPLAETQVSFTAARAIMAGTSLGIFDAIANGARTADAIASACGTDARATRALVDCLVALRYLRFAGGRYRNTRRVDKWLLARSPRSLRDKLVFQSFEWNLLARLEDFVRTGEAIDLHASLGEKSWELYQDGMRAVAAGTAPSIVRRIQLPPRPTRMLDVGGGHGLYSVALCRLHPTLRSEVLELPAALPRASVILAGEGMGDRVKHRAGDARVDDLGESVYDLILVNHLVHHFTRTENADLARRAFRALRPGGIFVIGDFEKAEAPGAREILGATMNLYFSLTSAAGTWSLDEMRSWQRVAGLVLLRTIRHREMPGYVTQLGRKPLTMNDRHQA